MRKKEKNDLEAGLELLASVPALQLTYYVASMVGEESMSMEVDPSIEEKMEATALLEAGEVDTFEDVPSPAPSSHHVEDAIAPYVGRNP